MIDTNNTNIPRVLFLTSNASLADGISRHILNICQYLITRKSEVAVAVCITHPFGDLSRELEAHGVKVYHLDAPNGHDVKIFWRFRHVLKDFNPTVIHSHIMSFFVRCALGLFAKSIPVVSTVHGIPDPIPVPESLCGKTITTLKNIRSRFANVIGFLCGSPNFAYYIYISTLVKMKRFVKGIPGDVVFNPINIPFTTAESVLDYKLDTREKVLSVLRSDFGYVGDERVKIIGFVGRLDKVKDLPSFLKVCNLIYKDHKDTLFVIVGCGPDEYLKDSSDALSLGKHLIWAGYRKNACDFIAAFDTLLMTSHREGGPIVVLEAFAFGTLVSSFDIPGGMQDIRRLADEAGVVVCDFAENRDCNAMAENVINRLWNADNNSNAMRESALQLLIKNYSPERVCTKLLKIYTHLSLFLELFK